MYRANPSPRDRIGTLVMVVAVHAVLAFALIHLSGPRRDQLPDEAIAVFDVTEEPPQAPPIVEKLPEPKKAEPKPSEAAASARNIESRATPVVAPRPPIALPIPQPMPVAQAPGQGSERTQGASDVTGPGTGAGGQGSGTGSGRSGGGTGAGGTGGGTGPLVIPSTKLTSRDYPPDVARNWPRGGRVFVAVRIQLDGRATDCKVNRSSGDPVVDAWTCRLVEQKVRFQPAVDGQGRPYVAWYGYIQG